ncbi:HD domain-containing phosphohydrolase [uncultured Rubinisphaera sp.]|uniref:HD-GYP domain-containing protein n=1 Tax=uncultured Rubinisphaera sp. TaxID=1678686 RepID=UPI0030D9F06B|tara:strand:- start:570 stop:1592 length:1023 start_codon:yes stop_codon:yes gene_type:complete
MNSYGISDSSFDSLKSILSEGLLESDLTKLKDLMLRLGRKMLDPEYRHQYAASLGDFSLNISRKMIDYVESGKLNSVSIIRLLVKYFEILNVEGSQAIRTLNEYAKDKQLTNEAVQNSIMAISIAKILGFSKEDIKITGIVGLFSKLGIVLLDQELINQPRLLNMLEKVSLLRMPLHLSELLNSLMGLNPKIPGLSQQIYELSDGSGYPRRLVEKNINPIARVIKVADIYTSLISERPYRKSVNRHVAIVYLLKMAKEQKVEMRSVNALLNVVGLYPKGVQVVLTDGRIAESVQASCDVSSPIVRIDSQANPLNLADTDLKVSKIISENNQISNLQLIPG